MLAEGAPSKTVAGGWKGLPRGVGVPPRPANRRELERIGDFAAFKKFTVIHFKAPRLADRLRALAVKLEADVCMLKGTPFNKQSITV